MNKIKTIIFSVLTFGTFAFASAQKVAHISLDSLMASMPETKTAKEAVQNFVKGFETEILAMQTELEGKYKDYMEKRETMSETVRQNKEQDITQLQKRMEDFKTQASMEIQKKQTDLGNPILQKAKKGIEAVAKENGYKYVLNTGQNANGAIYSEPSDDIFATVKKKLDSMPLAKLPGVDESAKTPSKPEGTPKKPK